MRWLVRAVLWTVAVLSGALVLTAEQLRIAGYGVAWWTVLLFGFGVGICSGTLWVLHEQDREGLER